MFKGDEVNRKKINKIILDNEIFLAKNSAFRYLGNRNHSSSELRKKLNKKGFRKEIIEKVLVDLITKKFIDDIKFTKAFVQFRIERRKEGIIKIHSELIKKGISNEIISEVINTFRENPIHYDNAIVIAQKKYDSLKDKSLEFHKLKGRLFNFLKGKGFTTDIIIKVVDDVLGQDDVTQFD